MGSIASIAPLGYYYLLNKVRGIWLLRINMFCIIFWANHLNIGPICVFDLRMIKWCRYQLSMQKSNKNIYQSYYVRPQKLSLAEEYYASHTVNSFLSHTAEQLQRQIHSRTHQRFMRWVCSHVTTAQLLRYYFLHQSCINSRASICGVQGW